MRDCRGGVLAKLPLVNQALGQTTFCWERYCERNSRKMQSPKWMLDIGSGEGSSPTYNVSALGV